MFSRFSFEGDISKTKIQNFYSFWYLTVMISGFAHRKGSTVATFEYSSPIDGFDTVYRKDCQSIYFFVLAKKQFFKRFYQILNDY